MCMQIVGAISCVASVVVVLTIFSVEALKKKAYNKYVLYIASANLFGSFGASLGFVREGTMLCWFQGLVTNYFPLLSLFWTTYLGYMLVRILSPSNGRRVAQSTMHNDMSLPLQGFIWIFPAILTLAPLSTNTYGVYGEEAEYGWCFIESCSRSTKWSTSFWVIVSFYLWIWAALATYICFFAYIYLVLTRQRSVQVRQVMTTAIQNLGYYLLVIILCWGFATVYDILDSLEVLGDFLDSSFSVFCSFVMPLFHGFLTAVVFFYTNAEASNYLKYYASCCTTENPALRTRGAFRGTSNYGNSGFNSRGISMEAGTVCDSTSSIMESSSASTLARGTFASSITTSPLARLDTVRETSERGSSRENSLQSHCAPESVQRLDDV